MQGLMIHGDGAKKVTRGMLDAVPVPRATRSWRPVAYGKAIDFLKHTIDLKLKLPIESEDYGLNKAGDQMFGLITLKTDSEESGLSIGLRQSYNKSLSLGLAVGSQVFVCDNLCFSGNAFKILRKNTRNVWADFRELVQAQVGMAMGHYEDIQVDTQKLKDAPCDERKGFSYLGIMQGEGLLTPTQATVAFGDWKQPRHQEFADRNLWGLYNAVTEGLKKGSPARILDRHAKAHDFFTNIRQLAA